MNNKEVPCRFFLNKPCPISCLNRPSMVSDLNNVAHRLDNTVENVILIIKTDQRAQVEARQLQAGDKRFFNCNQKPIQ